MEIEVSYMSGAGNLFTVIDNRKYNFDLEQGSNLAPLVCRVNEYNQFETEGLILINSSDDLHFESEFFNPDGSHGAMCGNGGRCAVWFANERKFFNPDEDVEFSMAGEEYNAQILDNSIKIFFPPPLQIHTGVVIPFQGLEFDAAYVNVGSDHCVIRIKDLLEIKKEFKHNGNLNEFDLEKFGPEIRNHEYFQPRGANVNIYAITKEGNIVLRTFERGVEAETGACGTGAISTAMVALHRGEVFAPVEIMPTSKIPLVVDVQGNFPDEIISVSLEGEAKILNSVTITIPDETIKNFLPMQPTGFELLLAVKDSQKKEEISHLGLS